MKEFDDRVAKVIRQYEVEFKDRGDVTPSDPLKFHLFHLARYWSRLVGFCQHVKDVPSSFVEGDLGACVKVGSDYANNLIDSSSPIFDLWQDYWKKTQAVLFEKPVSVEQVEEASSAFDACLTELKYDPWG